MFSTQKRRQDKEDLWRKLKLQAAQNGSGGSGACNTSPSDTVSVCEWNWGWAFCRAWIELWKLIIVTSPIVHWRPPLTLAAKAAPTTILFILNKPTTKIKFHLIMIPIPHLYSLQPIVQPPPLSPLTKKKQSIIKFLTMTTLKHAHGTAIRIRRLQLPPPPHNTMPYHHQSPEFSLHTHTRHARLTLDTHPIITFFSHMERLNELDHLHQYKNCRWDDSERRVIFLWMTKREMYND